MGMFRPSDTTKRLSKQQMLLQMEEVEAECLLCSTHPAGFVYDYMKQKVWCPRCGMPPSPAPKFLDNKETDK